MVTFFLCLAMTVKMFHMYENPIGWRNIGFCNSGFKESDQVTGTPVEAFTFAYIFMSS